MDLDQNRFETFDELYLYCYRVAGTVGLMMMPIMGTTEGYTYEEALEPALALGVALQLTNILRDVGEDRARQRIYLPQEELEFGVTEASLLQGMKTDKYVQLVKWQIDRARGLVRAAASPGPARRAGPPPPRAPPASRRPPIGRPPLLGAPPGAAAATPPRPLHTTHPRSPPPHPPPHAQVPQSRERDPDARARRPAPHPRLPRNGAATTAAVAAPKPPRAPPAAAAARPPPHPHPPHPTPIASRYSKILNKIEANNYDNLTKRAYTTKAEARDDPGRVAQGAELQERQEGGVRWGQKRSERGPHTAHGVTPGRGVVGGPGEGKGPRRTCVSLSVDIFSCLSNRATHQTTQLYSIHSFIRLSVWVCPGEATDGRRCRTAVGFRRP